MGGFSSGMVLGDLGGEPFDDICGWKRFVALHVEGNARRLSESDPRWDALLHKWSTLPIDTWSRELTSPSVVASVYEGQPRDDIGQLSSTTVKVAGSSVALHVSPGSQELRWLRAHGPGSKGSTSADAAFLDAASPEFDLARRGLAEGLSLLDEVAPGFALDVATFIEEIAFADAKASFRGATGLAHFGLAFYSPDASWDAAIWAEELVHEASHLLLESLSFAELIVLNEDAHEEKYQAPFRPDARNLYGNFHALFVLARLFHLLARLRDTEFSDAAQVRFMDYLNQSTPVLAELRRDVSLSDMGEKVMNGVIVPSFEAAEAAAAGASGRS